MRNWPQTKEGTITLPSDGHSFDGVVEPVPIGDAFALMTSRKLIIQSVHPTRRASFDITHGGPVDNSINALMLQEKKKCRNGG